MPQTRIASNNLIGAGCQFQAGSATLAPVTMPSGSLLTSALAGVLEYDGTCFYATPQSTQRGVIDTEIFVFQKSNHTLVSQTALQSIFNASGSGIAANLTTGLWAFETEVLLEALSTSTNYIGFSLYPDGSQNATYAWSALAVWGGSTLPINVGTATYSNTYSNAHLMNGSAGGPNAMFSARGTICGLSGAAVNIQPCLSQYVASASVVMAGSWFRAWPLGNDSVVQSGGWT